MAVSRAISSGDNRDGEDSDTFCSNQVTSGRTEKISSAAVLRFGARRLGSRRISVGRSIAAARCGDSEPKARKNF